MVIVHNFSYGLLTPALGYVMSCLGCFLGLRCTTRAREVQGSSRVRWLLLAGVSIGVAPVSGRMPPALENSSGFLEISFTSS